MMLLLASTLGLFAQNEPMPTLKGTWILSNIQSDDSVSVAADPQLQQKVTSTDKNAPLKTETVKMSVVDLMEKSLGCGYSHFIFEGDQFQFFRTDKASRSGTFVMKGDELLLLYGGAEAQNTKANKVISFTEDRLVISTESNGKPVVLSFFKK